MPSLLKFLTVLVWFGVFATLPLNSYAQKPKFKSPKKSKHLVADSSKIIGIKPPPDSLFTDSLKKLPTSDRIIYGLKEYSKRKSLPAKLVSSMFNFNRKRQVETGLDPSLINYEFSAHDYKIVRSIQIKTLDAFGYSISDTTRLPKNILERG